jgi:hypothetical protein
LKDHDIKDSPIQRRPTLADIMERASQQWQYRIEQWNGMVIEQTLLIKPLISIIQQYHGRYGHGDIVQLNIPVDALSSTPVPP